MSAKHRGRFSRLVFSLLHEPHPIIKIGYVLIALGLAAIGVLFLWLGFTPIPTLNTFDSRQIAQSTQIYDREGRTLLFDLNSSMRREVVPLTAVSPYLQQATIAIEDSRFYRHFGIDGIGIARAIWVDIQYMAFVQGGSTITQQVVKNTMLTNDKSITRKLKEVVLAIRMEQTYTKEEILEFYFNSTPYGGTMYGAEVAAQRFFNKEAADLTLAEAAYMAAIPQRPTFLSPYGNNRDALEARKNTVLARMLELDMITQEEHDAARETRVVFNRQQNNSILAPHFVFYIEEQLEERFGPDVATQGITVITTLDADLQREAEEVLLENAIRNEQRFSASNAALVAIDPKTGQILAMVGSRDYFDAEIDGNFNVAVAQRQPGSAFKPFVYAAALQKGYTTETAVMDLPTQFSTFCSPADVFNSTLPCYAPGNYDDTFRGPMTFRTAIAQSINVPAVKALYLAGIPNTLTLAKNLGLTTLGQPADYGLSLALGAAEVRLIDLVGAYAAFGNDGSLNTPVGILEIRDSDGRTIEQFEARPRQAVEPEVARQISSMLSDNQARQNYSSSNPFTFPGFDVAVKTGTTNESRDVWTVGYSPSIAIGVWAGNNDNSPMQRQTAGLIVAPMWNQIMQVALNRYPQEFFTSPQPIPDSLHPALRGISSDGSGTHDILYWVAKNDPRGGGTSRSDSQFPYWEYSIANNWNLFGATTTATTTVSEEVVPVPGTTTPEEESPRQRRSDNNRND